MTTRKTEKILLLILTVFFCMTSGCLRPSDKQKTHESHSLVLDIDFLHQGGTFWYQLRLNDASVGSQKTTLSVSQDPGEDTTLYTVAQDINIRLVQNETPLNSHWVLTSNERADGTFISAAKEQKIMSNKEETAFLVKERSVEKIVKTSDGTPFQTSLEHNVEACAPNMVMFSLWQKPMRVGEVRSFKYFDLMTENFVELKLTGVQVESAQIFQKEVRLLRLEGNILFPDGVSLAAVYWMDRNGNLVKYTVDQPGGIWEYTLSSPSELQSASKGSVSEMKQMLVPVKGKINDPAQTRQVRYRVQMKKTPDQTGMTLKQLLPELPGQTVQILTPQTAEVLVTLQEPSLITSPENSDSQRYSPNDLAANPWIQSTHPMVINIADKNVDWKLSPLEIAETLRTFIYKNMTYTGRNNFSSTASEISYSMSGGDLEYAILFAALVRVKETIPSRLVLGLVYAETDSGEPYMSFHLWNELYLNGSWIDMDATLANGGRDASRVRLADSNLTTETIEAFLRPILFAANNLQVEILESE